MGQKQSIAFSALVAVVVWTAWLTSLGSSSAFSHLIANWQISLTMVFGSMVAGGTATGGGAVAFPVFTKLLHIPPHDAKVFCLAIQSVGMSAAALTILVKGLRVDHRKAFVVIKEKCWYLKPNCQERTSSIVFSIR